MFKISHNPTHTHTHTDTIPLLDRTIKVYNVGETGHELSATLQGHEGPVWSLSWAHPRFGVLLASGSFDGSVMIHREVRPREWQLIHHARNLHESSVNTVAFSPNEYGLQVAAASSDGRVSVLTHEKNNTWTVEYLQDCPIGTNSVSWAPFGSYYDNNQTDLVQPRLVTAGCDNKIRFWSCKDNKWEEDATYTKHSDWVRDVAWAPGLLPNYNVVASCAEDRTVVIWKQQAEANVASWATAEWKPHVLHTFDAPVWRVSWSMTGHLLAVSSGDNHVTLWKQGLDDAWTQVSSLPAGNAPQPHMQS